MLGEQLLPKTCEDTNRSFWVSVIAIDVSALVLLFLVFWLFTRKNWLKAGFVRLVVVALPFAIAAGVILALYRPEAETVAKCLQIPDLQQLIFGRQFVPWQRGIVFGGAPVFLLAIMLKFVHGLIRK